MERIVYIIGAGFSAPLGLPVVRNFIEQAKDLYYGSPEQYSHFDSAFKLIDRYSGIKNYFNADLLDIEEILSLLETEQQLLQKSIPSEFARFIVDTVKGTTREDVLTFQTVDWPNHDEHARLWRHYLNFVASIFQVSVAAAEGAIPSYQISTPRYDVITLNYDAVLELCANKITQLYPSVKIGFQRPGSAAGLDYDGLPILAKIHGSVDSGIVPPTWAKRMNTGELADWKAAFALLSKANHIRFLGYSLPQNDSYIRYLFKVAGTEFKHLKRIDVITLDREGETQKRYRELITFKNHRFQSLDLGDFMRALHPQATDNYWFFPNLEIVHDAVFDLGKRLRTFKNAI